MLQFESAETATCVSCAETKPLDAFGLRKEKKNGRQSSCRECKRAYLREYEEKNPRDPAEVARQVRERRARRLGEEAAVRREFRAANRERILARENEWRAANRDRQRATAAAWRDANREKVRRWAVDIGGRRRAIQRETETEPVDLNQLWTGFCGICDEAMDRELSYPDPQSKSVDHIVPLARGGGHVKENLQYAHLVCNLRKGARVPEKEAL